MLKRASYLFSLYFLMGESKQQQHVSGTMLPSPLSLVGKAGEEDESLCSSCQPGPFSRWVPLLFISSSALPPITLLQGRARLASCAGEGTALPLSPPTPCLLGISRVAAAGLGATMLLNSALSKSEEKYTKYRWREGFLFFFKPLEKHLRNTWRKQCENWQLRKQNSRVYLHVALCLLL